MSESQRQDTLPEQRHAELERLRDAWTEAVRAVRVARPGSAAWAEGRLLERRAAARYVSELVEPTVTVHVLPVGEALDVVEKLSRDFADSRIAAGRPAVH